MTHRASSVWQAGFERLTTKTPRHQGFTAQPAGRNQISRHEANAGQFAREPQKIGSVRDICVHLCSSAANLASPPAWMGCGRMRSRSCNVQPRIVLPQMNADARRYFRAVGSFGGTSRTSGKSVRATARLVVRARGRMNESMARRPAPPASWCAQAHHSRLCSVQRGNRGWRPFARHDDVRLAVAPDEALICPRTLGCAEQNRGVLAFVSWCLCGESITGPGETVPPALAHDRAAGRNTQHARSKLATGERHGL